MRQRYYNLNQFLKKEDLCSEREREREREKWRWSWNVRHKAKTGEKGKERKWYKGKGDEMRKRERKKETEGEIESWRTQVQSHLRPTDHRPFFQEIFLKISIYNFFKTKVFQGKNKNRRRTNNDKIKLWTIWFHIILCYDSDLEMNSDKVIFSWHLGLRKIWFRTYFCRKARS